LRMRRLSRHLSFHRPGRQPFDDVPLEKNADDRIGSRCHVFGALERPYQLRTTKDSPGGSSEPQAHDLQA
jgi:hypothetical protein